MFVYVIGSATWPIRGSDNSAPFGGGVFNNGTFILTDSSVTATTASSGLRDLHGRRNRRPERHGQVVRQRSGRLP